MTKTIDQVIDHIKKQHPYKWKKAITDYLNRQLLFYKQFPQLAKIEIAYEFHSNKDNQTFRQRFVDIYDQLDHVKYDVMYEQFCKELRKYQEEVLNEHI